jgi:hypothetical protein
MGKPEDPEFERRIRREVYRRYKEAKTENQRITAELNRLRCRVSELEQIISWNAKIVALSEKIITDGSWPEES